MYICIIIKIYTILNFKYNSPLNLDVCLDVNVFLYLFI